MWKHCTHFHFIRKFWMKKKLDRRRKKNGNRRQLINKRKSHIIAFVNYMAMKACLIFKGHQIYKEWKESWMNLHVMCLVFTRLSFLSQNVSDGIWERNKCRYAYKREWRSFSSFSHWTRRYFRILLLSMRYVPAMFLFSTIFYWIFSFILFILPKAIKY